MGFERMRDEVKGVRGKSMNLGGVIECGLELGGCDLGNGRF